MNDAAAPASTHEGRIARELEEDIIFGRLQPGSRLREDDLLDRFGGTRHFVRQALARLERAGIVTRERNRGASVRSFSPLEVRQIYQVREMLQRQAVMYMPLPAPDSVIDRLQEVNEAYRVSIASGNLRATHELNDAFHAEFFAACENPYLRALVQEYMDLTLAIRAKNLADPELLQVSFQQHRLMIDYLQGSDNWLLAELCVEHIRPSKQRYLDMVET